MRLAVAGSGWLQQTTTSSRYSVNSIAGSMRREVSRAQTYETLSGTCKVRTADETASARTDAGAVSVMVERLLEFLRVLLN